MAKKKKQVKNPKHSKGAGDLPTTPEAWVEYINDVHDHAVRIRRKYEHQWTVNLAYYLGLQDLVFLPDTQEFQIPQFDEPKLVINRIGSFIESRQAKLTKNNPVPRVLPNTSDLEDQRAAKFSDQTLLHLWRSTGMDFEKDILSVQMLLYGVSFLKTVWNPDKGDAMIFTEEKDGQIEIDEEGDIQQNKVFMGEVDTEAVSPYAVLVADDSTPKMEKQDWVIERSFLSVAEAEVIYPHLRGKLKKEDKFEKRTSHERVVQRLASGDFGNSGIDALQKKDSVNTEVLVKTFWMKPNAMYERGVLAVVIQDQMALLTRFPNDYGRNIYPYVRFAERENGSHFWVQSTIERLIPIQRSYNDLSQQKLKNARLMANLKYLLPKGSQVSEASLTDEEGEVIEYNPSVPPPAQMSLSPLPGYFNELRRELIIDLRDAGGQREASVSPPPNITAAVALQTFAEQADESIGPMIKRFARSLSLTAEQQLILMNEEYIEERRIKIIGTQGQVAVQFLKNTDLRHHTDVHIEVESLFPEFRGLRQQRLTEWWDRRIIQDPAVFLRAYRTGNIDEILEQLEKRDERIHLIIEAIKQGKQPQLTPFDEKGRIAQALINFANTPEFLRLEPDRKQLLFAVVGQLVPELLQAAAGQPAETQQNQAAVATPSGQQRPVGAQQ